LGVFERDLDFRGESKSMALLDRLYDEEITVWTFNAAVWFWARGKLTRAQVIAGLQLAPEDETQLDILAANYLARSESEKMAFWSDLQAAGVLLSEHKITKNQYKDMLDL
jgi:hypothetical protein